MSLRDKVVWFWYGFLSGYTFAVLIIIAIMFIKARH